MPDLSGADFVVHCAAAVGDPVPGSPAEAALHAVNVDGTARLLHGRRPAGGVVSSASVYEPGPGRSRITENHPVRGHLNAYGRTKAAGEALALDAGAVVFGLRRWGPAPGAPAAVPRPPRATPATRTQRPPQPDRRRGPHRRLSAGRRARTTSRTRRRTTGTRRSGQS
ncbi:NAD-dependent epimerase/dehydratase family protein [Streptomyces sp. NPDC101165]|uniref:NAD-dependent epimerase/dehydratase family protein n=1 Tax=Streptomyces sp. NPDC101165 TaxID=3366119 RepID=UPI00382B3F92